MTYTTAEMRTLWGDQFTLDTWTTIEVLALEAQAQIGQVPREWADTAANAPTPDAHLWRETTTHYGHEVVAFLDLLTEDAEHVHIGLTSSDLVDTTLGLRVRVSTEHITRALEILCDAVGRLRDKYGTVARLGRTHGQPAIATTYGRLFARWEDMLERASRRLYLAGSRAAICKVSGPIGTHAAIDEYVEQYVADRLGLDTREHNSQIVARDELASWVAELGHVASVIEAIALELRLLAHSGVREVTDRSGSTSSAMPHKVNPNRLERLCGLARIVRSAYEPIAAGIAQWHERDMAHSSVERTLLPQATGIVHYMARSLDEILADLRIDPFAAAEHLQRYETETMSHAIMTHLQNRGYSYFDARERTAELLNTNISPAALRVATNKDPDLRGFTMPDIYLKEALDGIS